MLRLKRSFLTDEQPLIPRLRTVLDDRSRHSSPAIPSSASLNSGPKTIASKPVLTLDFTQDAALIGHFWRKQSFATMAINMLLSVDRKTSIPAQEQYRNSVRGGGILRKEWALRSANL